jgi:hypothetical protein
MYFSIHLDNSFLYFFLGGAANRFRVMASTYGASQSHSLGISHSVGLLWTRDQPDAGISTLQTQHSEDTNIIPPAGF